MPTHECAFSNTVTSNVYSKKSVHQLTSTDTIVSTGFPNYIQLNVDPQRLECLAGRRSNKVLCRIACQSADEALCMHDVHAQVLCILTCGTSTKHGDKWMSTCSPAVRRRPLEAVARACCTPSATPCTWCCSRCTSSTGTSSSKSIMAYTACHLLSGSGAV